MKREEPELKREIAFLYRVTRTVHSLEIEEVLHEIVQIAVEVTHADSCLVYVVNTKTDELILRASKNPHPDLVLKIKMKLGEGITGWVAKERRPAVISSGAAADPRFKYFSTLPEDRFEAFLSVPIVNRRGVIGVINVQHKNVHTHSEMEINLLTAIGKLVGGAVDNARLIEETMTLKETLKIRKLIEKAKGILMNEKKYSEEEAYKSLQKKSMRTRKSLKEIAEAVILASHLFNS